MPQLSLTFGQRAQPQETSKEQFTFFFGHDTRTNPLAALSNWFPSRFIVDGLSFNCGEQFIMYRKAMIFGDRAIAERILTASHPGEQKRLGRQVSGYREDVWAGEHRDVCPGDHREAVMRVGSEARFRQNPAELDVLLATEGTLVEASPYDRIWGIGLAASDPRSRNRSQWRGLNLYGQALTELREALVLELRPTAAHP